VELLRPLPLAAAAMLALLCVGGALAAAGSWPALQQYFAPAVARKTPPAASTPTPQPARSSVAVATQQSALRVKDSSEANAELLPHSERSPRGSSDLLAQANRLRQQRRWRAAEALYLRVLGQRPGVRAGSAAALAAAELRLSHLGRPRAALELFERALRMQPGGPLAEQARHGIAQSQRALGDAAREAAALERFLRQHPASLMRSHAEARLRELRASH
jgi:tetratricopeptide (TPR) repeat protein